MKREQVIHSNPEILGGTPVFVGTRVPVQTFIDYLKGGESVEDFLDGFPSVSRAQAEAFLQMALESDQMDTIRFINQFTSIHGDYTEEREALFGEMSLKQILDEIEQSRTKGAA